MPRQTHDLLLTTRLVCVLRLVDNLCWKSKGLSSQFDVRVLKQSPQVSCSVGNSRSALILDFLDSAVVQSGKLLLLLEAPSASQQGALRKSTSCV